MNRVTVIKRSHSNAVPNAGKSSVKKRIDDADLVKRVVEVLKAISARDLLVTFMLVLMLMFSAIGVVYSSHISRQLFAEQSVLLERNDQLQLEWAQLLLEQSAWSSPNRIETVAHEQLSMSLPESEQVELLY